MCMALRKVTNEAFALVLGLLTKSPTSVLSPTDAFLKATWHESQRGLGKVGDRKAPVD